MARPGTTGPSPLVQIAPKVTKRLTAAGYVFPVYGPSGFGDTFGAPRATTGWHHGQDIFAALGAPVLAVADGTLYSVGWNRVGGNRLWLRDRDGNEFYYAHLAAFSPLAVDGGRVRAGDVVGFVGNTGDAETTPYHLHFEIHPSSLLFLGYDGVVNAYPYLRAWQHATDVDFPSAAVWAPTLRATGRAPAAGAILLQSTDISVASGLDPGSLAQAIAPAAGGRSVARELQRSRVAYAAVTVSACSWPLYENSPPDTRPFTQRRVSGPVNGLKKMPIATPIEDQEDVAEAVAVGLLGLLDPVGRVAQLRDRAHEALLDVLVLRDLGGEPGHALLRHELVVDLLRGDERRAEALAELLVRDGLLDVRSCRLGGIANLARGLAIRSPRFRIVRSSVPPSPTP